MLSVCRDQISCSELSCTHGTIHYCLSTPGPLHWEGAYLCSSSIQDFLMCPSNKNLCFNYQFDSFWWNQIVPLTCLIQCLCKTVFILKEILQEFLCLILQIRIPSITKYFLVCFFPFFIILPVSLFFFPLFFFLLTNWSLSLLGWKRKGKLQNRAKKKGMRMVKRR